MCCGHRPLPASSITVPPLASVLDAASDQDMKECLALLFPLPWAAVCPPLRALGGCVRGPHTSASRCPWPWEARYNLGAEAE